MYELLQNLLAWCGQASDDACDAVPDDVVAGSVSERLHRDLDACFQAIHEQISERRQ